MGMLRIATVVAVGVALLPAEPESQEALYKRAAATTTWVVTFCDRNATVCTQSAKLWQQFVAKAEFGAKLAYDMMREGEQIRSESAMDAPIAPASLERGSGTLTKEDLAPAWRGKPRSKGSI